MRKFLWTCLYAFMFFPVLASATLAVGSVIAAIVLLNFWYLLLMPFGIVLTVGMCYITGAVLGKATE